MSLHKELIFSLPILYRGYLKAISLNNNGISEIYSQWKTKVFHSSLLRDHVGCMDGIGVASAFLRFLIFR